MSTIRKVANRIAPYMKAKGFELSGKNYYYISNDIAYCLALDQPGGLIYVTAYIMPLYVPCEYRYYTYGSRLNNIHGIVLSPLHKDANPNAIDEWCEMLCRSMDQIIIPFYQQIGTPRQLVEYIDGKMGNSTFLCMCPNVFLERLKMYTYLLLRDFAKTNTAMNSYRNLLTNCTFLTDAVCKEYLCEIETIRLLLHGNDQDISNFCCEISRNTQKILM